LTTLRVLTGYKHTATRFDENILVASVDEAEA